MSETYCGLNNGDIVMLYPNDDNPLYQKPHKAIYLDGYFYCEESNPMDGPDYYLGDIYAFNDSFEVLSNPTKTAKV